MFQNSYGMLPLLLLISATAVVANFIRDPKCPPATPQLPAACAGRRSSCWSPGVRDLDCPGSGLCCYDGCANTCLASAEGQPVASPSIQYPSVAHPPKHRSTTTPPPPPPRPTTPPPPPPPVYVPAIQPDAIYLPPEQPEETYGVPLENPAVEYLPPAIQSPPLEYGPPVVQTSPQDYGPPVIHSPPQEYGPPVAQSSPQEYGPPVVEHPISSPSVQIENRQPAPVSAALVTCPHATPLSPGSCQGRHSTCWSVGVSDLDCPGWGLCCFDGCANTCLNNNPPPPPVEPPIASYGPPPAPRTTPAPPPPRNPCDPNPCGPGAMCIPQEGLPMCKCPEGLVPNPTPRAGCIVPNPCHPNPCGPGAMCIPQEGRPACKCPEGLVPDPRPEIKCSPRDPCKPSPCGPGTTCTPNRDGNPICKCLPGLIPKPDTITGCGPECVVDPDCRSGLVCREQKCVERPDPCKPSPCGPGTTCTPNRDGNPICKCLPGLIPKPDTITGCGPECIVDPDCQHGYVCRNQQCLEAPDPCVPNPCGPGAVCILQGEGFSCECPAGFVGDARTGCYRGECTVDDECAQDKACQNYYCKDPCLSGTCSSTDFCRVMRHVPICGYNYDPPAPEPKDEFIIGERYAPASPPDPRPKVVIGARHEPQARTQEPRTNFVVGGGFEEVGARLCSGVGSCGQPPMMMMMDTSNLPVIGASFNRRKRRDLLRKLLQTVH